MMGWSDQLHLRIGLGDKLVNSGAQIRKKPTRTSEKKKATAQKLVLV